MRPPEIDELLAELSQLAARQGTRGRSAGGGGSGFASKPPIDLGALELHDRLAAAPWDSDLRELAERFIDGRHKMPGGECWNCKLPVSAYADETTMICPHGCPAIIDISQNRREALATARELLLTAAEIEHRAPTFGISITSARIRQWASRKRIEAIGGRYRLADVLALMERG
jgi:hypothetical protein